MLHCPTLDHTRPSWKHLPPASSQSGGNGVVRLLSLLAHICGSLDGGPELLRLPHGVVPIPEREGVEPGVLGVNQKQLVLNLKMFFSMYFLS